MQRARFILTAAGSESSLIFLDVADVVLLQRVARFRYPFVLAIVKYQLVLILNASHSR